MGQPRPLFHLFLVFSTNITAFTTNKCEKCPSSIWRRESNPRPLECESLPITTRPGLPPPLNSTCLRTILRQCELFKTFKKLNVQGLCTQSRPLMICLPFTQSTVLGPENVLQYWFLVRRKKESVLWIFHNSKPTADFKM